MAVSAVVADWSGARYLEGNDESLEEYMTQSRVEANMNTDDYVLTAFTLNTDEGVTVQYRGKDYKFTVEITSSGNSAKVTYGSSIDSEGGNDEISYVKLIDGSWDEYHKVNSPELFEGMTAIYWNEAGEEIELTDSSSLDEWEQWYDYNGNGDGQNKWANAVTKDSSGNITGYWVWIPRYAYKIESGLFTSTAGTISVKFLKNTSDLDEEGTTIGRTYSYSGEAMTDYVVHPAFRNGTDNNFKLGEWDEEVSGFWVAKYEAGYQANTITDNNGTLSTTISNADDDVVYSDLKYTNYRSDFPTNSLLQDLSSTDFSSEKLSYPVFLPLTYSYNIICIGDSYVLSEAIDTANSFYGLNSSVTDSHMMKNSEWGAVVYLAQSNFGKEGVKIAKNNYYTNEDNESPYKMAVTGLTGTSEEKTNNLSNVMAYNTPNGMKGSSTGNITGVYDLNGGDNEYVAGFITNGNRQLVTTGISNGSSGSLLGTTNISNANGYLSLSERNHTVYAYDSSNDTSSNNFISYKNLLSDHYGYGDAILEISSSGEGYYAWNSDSSYFAYNNFPFFIRGGDFSNVYNTGSFYLRCMHGGPYCNTSYRVVLINE